MRRVIVSGLLLFAGISAAPILLTAAYRILPEGLPVVTPMAAVVGLGVILLIKRKLMLGVGLIVGTVGWGVFLAFVLDALDSGMNL